MEGPAVSGVWYTTGGGWFIYVAAIAAAAAAIEGTEWVLARIWWIIGAAFVIAVLTGLVLARLMRWARARDERDAVAWERRRVQLEVPRPARAAEIPPPQPQAIAPVSVYVINVANADQAAIIRQALPGQAEDAVTEGNGLGATEVWPE